MGAIKYGRYLTVVVPVLIIQFCKVYVIEHFTIIVAIL